MKHDVTETRTSIFTTRAQHAFKQGGGRRMLAAAGVALIALALLVLLGPDKEDVERRFEYYGAPGDMRIMPEISIDEGSDRVAQLPKSLQAPPPPARIEVLPEEDDPDAVDLAPRPVDTEDVSEVLPVEAQEFGESAVDPQVELMLPRQSNPDWNILHMVRPEYPLGASEAERRLPVIRVKLDVFLRPDGTVGDILEVANDGSPRFAQAARLAVKQWIFGWRVDPGAGRWLRLEWQFKSPYFNPLGRPPE